LGARSQNSISDDSLPPGNVETRSPLNIDSILDCSTLRQENIYKND